LHYEIYGVYLISDVSWCEIVTKFYIGSRFFRIVKMTVTIKEELIQENCYILGGFSKNSMFNPSEETSGTSSIYLEAGRSHC